MSDDFDESQVDLALNNTGSQNSLTKGATKVVEESVQKVTDLIKRQQLERSLKPSPTELLKKYFGQQVTKMMLIKQSVDRLSTPPKGSP